MEYIIVILTIIIILLITYLFLVKKDLKRLSKEIKKIKENDSNNLAHSEISLRELDELINEINYIIDESKKEKINSVTKTKELRKMITNISHDLRTPLTSALGYIDLLLSSNKVQDKKTLKIVEERLKKLESLINSFFEFSKINLQDKTISKEKINLIGIIEESIAGYYEDYSKETRTIILKNNLQKIIIDSNKEMLTRIFDNLISNALKHSTSDLIIEIEKQDNIKIEFINDLLYPDLDISHIFDEFYTIDIARTKGNTGLGLAIAKEFVEKLGGIIYAKKDDNKLIIGIELTNH